MQKKQDNSSALHENYPKTKTPAKIPTRYHLKTLKNSKPTMARATKQSKPDDDPTSEREETDAAGLSYSVPGLECGLRILAEFSSHEPVLGAPELSRRIGIPRTTTFCLLQTLESLGFLERAADDRSYRLGVAVLRLGFEYLSSLELTDFGQPILDRLRDDTGFSSHLLIRDERDVVFVARAQTRDPMFSSVKIHVGTRLPATPPCTDKC